MMEKFGRDLKTGGFDIGSDSLVEFQVQSYLRHQGDAFSKTFDANTYILMTHALDYFDLAREYDDDAAKAFENARCGFLVISFTSDWRFSPGRSREIVDALIAAKRPVSYAQIESPHGHDAFLVPNERYQNVLTAYMQRIRAECAGEAG
jgi:homoserine O-acetyltransferase